MISGEKTGNTSGVILAPTYSSKNISARKNAALNTLTEQR